MFIGTEPSSRAHLDTAPVAQSCTCSVEKIQIANGARKNLTAVRLPLRHEVGDLSCLGKQRKEYAEGGGPLRAERAGVSESLGRGEVVLRAQGTWFLQSNWQSAVSPNGIRRRVVIANDGGHVTRDADKPPAKHLRATGFPFSDV